MSYVEINVVNMAWLRSGQDVQSLNISYPDLSLKLRDLLPNITLQACKRITMKFSGKYVGKKTWQNLFDFLFGAGTRFVGEAL